MKSIDIIIPVYNEGHALKTNLSEIRDTLHRIPDVSLRIIIVDDGSDDETGSVAAECAQKNSDVEVVSLTRNFGKEAAILSGLEFSRADAVIVMDSDLQHPPGLAGRMIDLWRQGLDVVEACKLSRGRESVVKEKLARSFYFLFRSFVGMDLENHSDFKLLDRKVVRAYLGLPERKRFFRGLIPWLGFSSAKIYFEVPERKHGRSGWNIFKLFRLSIDAITGFTSAPLYLIILAGLLSLVMAVVIGGTALYYKFAGIAVSGFTTVILLILLLGSFIMFGLGLIGIYLGQIFEEVKNRPVYLVDKTRSTLSDKENQK